MANTQQQSAGQRSRIPIHIDVKYKLHGVLYHQEVLSRRRKHTDGRYLHCLPSKYQVEEQDNYEAQLCAEKMSER